MNTWVGLVNSDFVSVGLVNTWVGLVTDCVGLVNFKVCISRSIESVGLMICSSTQCSFTDMDPKEPLSSIRSTGQTVQTVQTMQTGQTGQTWQTGQPATIGWLPLLSGCWVCKLPGTFYWLFASVTLVA
jgi:hypothetical protein